MKVRAKSWMKHNGVWYRGGDELEVSTTEVDELGELVEIAETPVQIPVPEEAPKKRGRQKKAE